MKNMDAMMSSKNNEWETPDGLFGSLHSVFGFTMDAAANEFNAKLPRYHTVLDSGLECSWRGETVWCNPPYGDEIENWATKFVAEAVEHGVSQVVLVPSRTETKWFQKCLMFATSVTFISGRLKFKGGKHCAPFPSSIFTFGADPEEKQVKALTDIGIYIAL